MGCEPNTLLIANPENERCGLDKFAKKQQGVTRGEKSPSRRSRARSYFLRLSFSMMAR